MADFGSRFVKLGIGILYVYSLYTRNICINGGEGAEGRGRNIS